jgi:hypothetical protein
MDGSGIPDAGSVKRNGARNSMDKFKPGDRVACWIYGGRRLTGTISYAEGDALDIHLDEPFGDEKQTVWPVHPKQLRRLRPKKRRRIFIQRDEFAHVMNCTGGAMVNVWHSDRGCSDYIEFVVVNRKKEVR